MQASHLAMNFLILLASGYLSFCSVSSSTPAPRYEAIFNFGDSLSDTGNFLLSGALAFPVIAKLPYGETFFRHATGRCSDGRLVIDFIGNLCTKLPTKFHFLFFFFLIILITLIMLVTYYCIAEAFGLPHLPPYLAATKFGGQNFHHGANFAVAGATALGSDFFYKQNIGRILWTNDSLSVQLDWFRTLKSSLCKTKPGLSS